MNDKLNIRFEPCSIEEYRNKVTTCINRLTHSGVPPFITQSELASMLNLSVVQMSRVATGVCSLSPERYLTLMRISNSVMLSRNSSLSCNCNRYE